MPYQVKCAPCSRPILPHKKVPTVPCALQAFHNEKVPASQESPHNAALSPHIKAGCGWMLLKFYKLTLAPELLEPWCTRGDTINTLQLCYGTSIHSGAGNTWHFLLYIYCIFCLFLSLTHTWFSPNTKTANFVTIHFQKKCKQIICCNRLTLHFNLKYITRHLCFISFRCAPSGCFNCKNALNVGFTDIFHSV